MTNYSYILSNIVKNGSRSLSMISEAEFSNKSFPKKWSKKEVLGHLIDSAVNNLCRFSAAACGGSFHFNRYNQDHWVDINDYYNRQGKELIELWVAVNTHIAKLISKIPDKILLEQTSDHNFDEICMLMVEKGSKSSLSYLIWDYIYHLEHHLAQIISTYEYELNNFEEDQE